MPPKTKVLYISYDGMTDPLGQSQVIAYLKRLSERDFSFDIISFEKPEVYHQKKDIVNDLISGYDITWNCLFYTKKPPVISTIKDIRAGWNKIKFLYKKGRYDIVHCRGYIPSILGLKCKKKYASKFIFDMRGWWADEKLESGLWNSIIYKPVYTYFKKLEKDFFYKSDISISLTFSGKNEIVSKGLKSENNVKVIPTCVDLEIFKSFNPEIRKAIRSELNVPEESIVMLYSGSLGGNYGTDSLLVLFQSLQRLSPDSVLLLITPTDREFVYSELQNFNIDKEKVRIVKTDYINVHKYLMVGDFGTIFYKKTFSAIGRSPTKLGEYWACGIPMISVKGIGDLDYLTESFPEAGILIDNINLTKDILNQLLKFSSNKKQLRAHAESYYNIESGVDKYEVIYNSLL